MDVQREVATEKQEETFKSRMHIIAEYFVRSIRTHRLIGFAWFASDCLGLIVAISNFFFINVFLGGDFFNYGLEVRKCVFFSDFKFF